MHIPSFARLAIQVVPLPTFPRLSCLPIALAPRRSAIRIVGHELTLGALATARRCWTLKVPWSVCIIGAPRTTRNDAIRIGNLDKSIGINMADRVSAHVCVGINAPRQPDGIGLGVEPL